MEKINIKYIKKSAQFIHNDSKFINDEYVEPTIENSYQKFIKDYKDINKKLSNTLKNDEEDVKNLLMALDNTIETILNYRHDIIEHLNYCENEKYYLPHKFLNS